MNLEKRLLGKEYEGLGNKDELLAVAARVEECDVAGLIQEIIDWAESEQKNKDIYDTLNTVAYTILEHCQVD